MKVADGFVQEVHSKGTIQMNIFGMKTIKNVLHILGLDSYLFSGGQFLNYGYSTIFENSKCSVYEDRTKKNCFLMFLWLKNKVFLVNVILKVTQDRWKLVKAL